MLWLVKVKANTVRYAPDSPETCDALCIIWFNEKAIVIAHNFYRAAWNADAV